MVGVPHWLPVGVNRYVVFPINAVLIVEGLHTPGIPSIEVEGNAAAVEPWQNGPIGANETAISGFTVTFTVVDVAHWPADGVNVYVVVPGDVVLIVAGFHVPFIPFTDVSGREAPVVF